MHIQSIWNTSLRLVACDLLKKNLRMATPAKYTSHKYFYLTVRYFALFDLCILFFSIVLTTA